MAKLVLFVERATCKSCGATYSMPSKRVRIVTHNKDRSVTSPVTPEHGYTGDLKREIVFIPQSIPQCHACWAPRAPHHGKSFQGWSQERTEAAPVPAPKPKGPTLREATDDVLSLLGDPS